MRHKGVLCFNPHSREVLISRYVLHNKEVFPFKDSLSFSQTPLSHSASSSSSSPFTLVMSSISPTSPSISSASFSHSLAPSYASLMTPYVCLIFIP